MQSNLKKGILLLLIVFQGLILAKSVDSTQHDNIYIVKHDQKNVDKEYHVYELVEVERKLDDIKKQIALIKETELKSINMQEKSITTLQNAVKLNQESFYEHINHLYWAALIVSTIVIAIATVTGLMYRKQFNNAEIQMKEFLKEQKGEHNELRTQLKSKQTDKLNDLQKIIDAYNLQVESLLTENKQLKDKIEDQIKHLQEVAGDFQVNYEELQNSLKEKVDTRFLELIATEGCDDLQPLIKQFISCVCPSGENRKFVVTKPADDAPEFL